MLEQPINGSTMISRNGMNNVGNIQQGTRTIIKYVNELKSFWQELGHYRKITQYVHVMWSSSRNSLNKIEFMTSLRVLVMTLIKYTF